MQISRSLPRLLCVLLILGWSSSAGAVTYEFNRSISDGDIVDVTVSLEDAAEGGAVDVQVSISPGGGDILGVFGNVASEAIISSMAVTSGGLVTQSSFSANKVWKVGGGNNLNPAPKKWDWGVRIGESGSAGGAVESATFRLHGPGLTTAELLSAANDNWVLGVRIQSTNGGEGSAKLGLEVGVSPTIPPVLVIDLPVDGLTLASTPAAVEGRLIGGTATSISVNGISASLGTGGRFSVEVPLVEGTNTLVAQADTIWGPLGDQVTVQLDTQAPVVTITAPANGFATSQASVLVNGSVSDASPIQTLTLNGEPVLLESGSFSVTLPLAVGENAIIAQATDIVGHEGSGQISIVRGIPPSLSIESPLDGALLGMAQVLVSGTVAGTAPLSVTLNGQAASVSSGAYSGTWISSEGLNSILVEVRNDFGVVSNSVQVDVDTLPPVIEIQAPVNGVEIEEATVSVQGLVSDASAIVELWVGGVAVAPGTSFLSDVSLEIGSNTIQIAAVDEVGHVGTASVTVTRAELGNAPSISILSPPHGRISFENTIAVTGLIDPVGSIVRVNGVLATTTDGRFVASAVPLPVEGENLLVATAENDGFQASDEVAVLYDDAPFVYINTPRRGDILRSAEADIEGMVDDVTALVDVNGVVASVDSSGHFIARNVPLALGENELLAHAVDPYGASSSHMISVTRDDASAPKMRMVFVDPYRYTMQDYLEAGVIDFDPFNDRFVPWEYTQIAAENVEEFKSELNRLGFPPENFTTDIEEIRIQTWRYDRQSVFVFSDEPGNVTVEYAGYFFQETFRPMEELFSDIANDPWSGIQVDSEAQARIVPQDFEPKYAALFSVNLSCNDCPDAVREQIYSTRAIVATTDFGSASLPVYVDTEATPYVLLDSPLEYSTVSDAPLTVTGRIFASAEQYSLYEHGQAYGDPSDRPIFREMHYRVIDYYGVITDEGFAQVTPGYFVLPDLILPSDGRADISVNLIGASGIQGGITGYSVYVDPTAPTVTLLSPQDGSTLLEDSVSLSFNFSEPVGLLSVNGAQDLRSFPAGIAIDILEMPLAFGKNEIVLEVASESGPSTHVFTLFRFDSLENIQITAPRHSSWLNTSQIVVEGTAPLGTPYIEVNEVAAEMLSGGAAFRAVLNNPEEGHLEITAHNPLLDQTDSVDIFADYTPPALLDLPPPDGSVTTSSSLVFGGAVSEHATVQVDTGSFSWGGNTYADDGFAGLIFSGEASIYQAQTDAYPFYAGRIPLEMGSNPVSVTLTDFAGNVTVIDRSFLRNAGLLSLIAPASGSSVATATVPLQLQADAPLVIDTLYVGPRRFSAYSGLELATGVHDLPAVLLAEGANEVRAIYRDESGTTSVENFQITGTVATNIVSGSIVDASTGEVIAGAQVQFTVDGVVFSVTTDGDGNFSTSVPTGAVTIEATAEGYGTVSETVNSSDTTTVALSLNGVTEAENYVSILVPPEGTVTDWDAVTVVGTVMDTQSTVSVNGIPARVVGNHFTASAVPLVMGENTLEVRAIASDGGVTLSSSTITRSDSAIPALTIYSPPDGARIHGGGLIVRGFTSARSGIVELHDRTPASLQISKDGVFEAIGVSLSAGENELSADLLIDAEVAATDSVFLSIDMPEAALGLEIEPSIGILPLFSSVWLVAHGDGIVLECIDFDWDGDGVLDDLDTPVGLDHVFGEERSYGVRAFLTTTEGVEYVVGAYARAVYPPVTLEPVIAIGNPVDLAVDSEGRLFVLDGAAGRVKRFTGEGIEDLQFGENLSGPKALAIHPDGRVFIADTGNHRIQVYASDGQYESTIGEYGTALGEFDSPSGLAIDGASLVVADTGNHRMQRLELDGSSAKSVYIQDPRGVASDSGWGAVVASPSEGLIAVSSSGAGYLSQHLSGIPAEGSLVGPIDIASGSDGFAIVDGATGAVVVLERGLGYRRVLPGLDAKAVAFGSRNTRETIYVADGQQVIEIELPITSPMPIFEAFRQKLGEGDIDAALERIAPSSRDRYRSLYEAILPDLAAEAADMEDAYLSRLSRGRGLIMLPRRQEVQGRMIELVYPMYLNRSEDGQWQIFSY